MRHRVAGRKMNRSPAHRKALRKNLIRSLLIEFGEKDHVITTKTKAKYVQPHVEKMITLAKNKTLHNVRRAMAVLQDRELCQKLFDEIGPYYTDRPGGYTRVIKLSTPRLGDNATRAYFGFVRKDEDEVQAEVATEEAAS